MHVKQAPADLHRTLPVAKLPAEELVTSALDALPVA